jgi:heme-degrading monooxygenase HmoA
MTVLMTLRVRGDASKVEELAAESPGTLQTIVERAKEHGVISHRFYGNSDEVLVVDEWPSEEAFQAFFHASPDIGEVMQRAGVTSEPEITFWRKLDSKDEVG